jgi:hypothetical protein
MNEHNKRKKASTSAAVRLLCLCCLALFSVQSTKRSEAAVDFEKDIRPILEENCWHCHGEDEQESGLRLDKRAMMLRGGDYGLPTLVPGHPEKSYLIEVVEHRDPDMAMPTDGDKLPEQQIELLRQWITEGAQWPGQMNDEITFSEDEVPWSFHPVVRPLPPNELEKNPVDAFLIHKLRENGLGFSGPATPATLIRRASVVLTGLPPKPESVYQFEEACKTDVEGAYIALVEDLLASPHFGERWAQHWLDVIRWAETNGSESNMYRKNAWIYRDYVIRAFNEDTPYNDFLTEQIAGDVIGQGDATGYLVSGPHVPVATVGQEPSARRQARADRMDEILQTVGASALGVTIGCARCHNHKFDPITIRDYYSLSAVFQDVEFGSRYPELDEHHPRRKVAQQLYKDIAKQRYRLREAGAWQEDWAGYGEIHFPSTTTEAVRITFLNRYIGLDELEIFGIGDLERNVASTESGATVTTAPGMEVLRNELWKVNDGEYGTERWAARVPQGKKENPWLEFRFPTATEVDRIRLSNNRENFFDTDYLTDLKPFNFPKYRIETQANDGTWHVVADSENTPQLNKTYPFRNDALSKLQTLITRFNTEGPRPSFIGRFKQPGPTHVFHRGSPENPRDEVAPSAPLVLAGDLQLQTDASGRDRRKAFAEWLTSPENPLPARVMVNRIWHHVFGQGIVTTTGDFGFAGAQPTHPELLDWLASEFITPTVPIGNQPTRAWSTKHILRLLVTSRAFTQDSKPDKEALAIDGTSRLLWRFPPRRLEAEVIRDAILTASDSLDPELGGPSYRIHNIKKRYAQWQVLDNHSEETWRRMIYQERMRRVDDCMFTAFDFPDCGQVRAKRPVSTTPLQALNLMNSPFVMSQSKLIAKRALKESGNNLSKAIDRCFELLLARHSTGQEKTAVQNIKAEELFLVCRAILNSNAFTFLE